MTTTERQAPKTIESPFGIAILRDKRDHSTPLVDTLGHNDERRLATIYFDELTVNRKTYVNVTLTVKHRYGRLSVAPESYRELTSSAAEKVEDYFLNNQPGLFYPYMLDLSPAERKASYRARTAWLVLHELQKIAPRKHSNDADAQMKLDALDEILEDIVEARNVSKPYESIKLETGGW